MSLQLRAQTFRYLEVLTAMAAIYWIMGYPQAKLAQNAPLYIRGPEWGSGQLILLLEVR